MMILIESAIINSSCGSKMPVATPDLGATDQCLRVMLLKPGNVRAWACSGYGLWMEGNLNNIIPIVFENPIYWCICGKGGGYC